MPFFASDSGLAEATANPKPSQAYQPQATGTSTLGGGTSISQNPLAALAQMGGNGGYNGDWLSQSAPGGIGGAGGIGGGMLSPGGGIPAAPTQGLPPGLSSGFGDGGMFGGTGLSPYDSFQQWGNAPAWQRSLMSQFIPGNKYGAELLHGINPLTGKTFDWFEADTDYFGNAKVDGDYTTAAALGSSSGFGSDYGSSFSQSEQDVADMFGWGSDEHMAAIGESFGEGAVGGGFTSGFDADDGGYGDDSDDGGAGWGNDGTGDDGFGDDGGYDSGWGDDGFGDDSGDW